MQLTKEQIQQIEHYLDTKQLTYIDIRLEVLDHIISDIENMMENEHQSFETSFRRVTIKWRSQLRLSSSLFVGLAYSRPKIVIKKVNKFYLKWFILTLIAVTIPFLLNSSILSINDYTNINTFIIYGVILLNVLLLFLYIKLIISGIQSSYRFIFEKQVIFNSIVSATFILITLSKSKEISNSPNMVFVNLLTVLGFLGFNLYKKHQHVVKSIKNKTL